MERLSELEKWRIAELAAQGWPARLIGKEIGRAHSAVRSNLLVMLRPPVPERSTPATRSTSIAVTLRPATRTVKASATSGSR